MSKTKATAHPSAAVTIRRATDRDEAALGRLAALDSRRPLTGVVLIAEVDRRPRAALSLTTGHAVADPFHLTADLLTLLQERARHLRGADAPRTSSTLAFRLPASGRSGHARSG